MTADKIKTLAEVFISNNLTKLEACEGGVKILLERAVAQTYAPSPAPALDAIEYTATPSAQPAAGFIEIKSPIVGVFYSAPSPDSAPFVHIGDTVKKGDVLCIIEAMKLLNEITAETDGEVADICIKNGDIAEYGQTLFKLVRRDG